MIKLEQPEVIQNLENFQFTEHDLVKFMQDFGKLAQREWNDILIDVFVYVYQHIGGAIILIQNNTDHPYEEIMMFQMQNLKIKCQVEEENSIIRFALEAKNHLLVYLEIINPELSFYFEMKSNYKLYPDE